ncbi:MAG: hypothetical protein JNJ48_05410 [Phycisphaerae bacterium]|nr:hypothetical protein [Phycisphaerae bacterium]
MPIPLLLGIIVVAMPPGIVLLALGSFSRRGGACRACGYSRAGLRPDTRCPECGGSDWEPRTIPRSRWQLLVGGGLVGLSIAAAMEILRGLAI